MAFGIYGLLSLGLGFRAQWGLSFRVWGPLFRGYLEGLGPGALRWPGALDLGATGAWALGGLGPRGLWAFGFRGRWPWALGFSATGAWALGFRASWAFWV